MMTAVGIVLVWYRLGSLKIEAASYHLPFLESKVHRRPNFTFSRGWAIIGIVHFRNGLIDLTMCALPHIACDEEDVTLSLVLVARYQ
jgi:hypothetical protein